MLRRGSLSTVFGSEMTTALGTCGSCGAVGPVGAVHVYVAAGMVLRCPSCEAVLMRIVESESRLWVDLTGLRSIELRR